MQNDSSLKKSLVKKCVILWLTSLVSLTGPAVHAQQKPNSSPKPTPPDGPLIQKRAPDFASWNITQRAAKSAKEQTQVSINSKGTDAKEILQKTTIIKTGDIVHTEFVDADRRAWNIWIKGNSQVVEWPDGKNIGFVEKPTNSSEYNPLFMDFSRSDFQGFDWISSDNYVGTSSVSGKPCLVFKDTTKSSSNPALGNGLSDVSTAYVDLETRLPVALSNRYGVTVYEILSAPSSMQILPPSVQAFIDKDQHTRQLLVRRASIPY